MKGALPLIGERADCSLPVAQLLVLLPFRMSATAPPPIQESGRNLAVVSYQTLGSAAALRPPMVPVGVLR